jgi:hypothetical protein
MARKGESFEAEVVEAYPSLLRSLTQDTYAEKGGKLGRLYKHLTYPDRSFRLEILLLVLDLIPFLYMFLAGKSVLATPLLMSPLLYLREMSGFKPKPPKRVRYQYSHPT